MSKIRVLVVDDSLLARGILTRNLSLSDDIEVIGTAKDAFDARDKILLLKPDVLTLDVQMPKMNGIDFLRLLLPQHPIPVVVVSSAHETVFDALSVGAIDFVEKPKKGDIQSQNRFIDELSEKIRIASKSKVGYIPRSIDLTIGQEKCKKEVEIIAIGASTGGTEALHHILSNLTKKLPPIVMVQHMPVSFTGMFAQRLNRNSLLTVKEVKDEEVLKWGHAYLATGDKHIVVRKTASKSYVYVSKNERKVNGHKPSVDVLFNSVSKEFACNSMGIILTGMGEDGAKGLLEMKQKGAITLGQNKETCVVYGMPKSAFRIGAVSMELSLGNIIGKINEIVKNR